MDSEELSPQEKHEFSQIDYSDPCFKEETGHGFSSLYPREVVLDLPAQRPWTKKLDQSVSNLSTIQETAQKSRRFWIIGQNADQNLKYAKELMPGPCYEKTSKNEWWNGFKSEDNIIISEMSQHHAYYNYHLLNFCNLDTCFPIYQIRSKSPIYINPERICITSKWSIHQLFGDDPIMYEHLSQSFQEIQVVNVKVLKRAEEINKQR